MQDHTGLTVTLIYTVFRDYPVITRSVRAENRGDQLITLDKIYSSSTDFPTNNYDLLHLWGSWAMERTPERTPADPWRTADLQSARLLRPYTQPLCSVG